jgi:hypothetical protein
MAAKEEAAKRKHIADEDDGEQQEKTHTKCFGPYELFRLDGIGQRKAAGEDVHVASANHHLDVRGAWGELSADAVAEYATRSGRLHGHPNPS